MGLPSTEMGKSGFTEVLGEKIRGLFFEHSESEMSETCPGGEFEWAVRCV